MIHEEFAQRDNRLVVEPGSDVQAAERQIRRRVDQLVGGDDFEMPDALDGHGRGAPLIPGGVGQLGLQQAENPVGRAIRVINRERRMRLPERLVDFTLARKEGRQIGMNVGTLRP